MQLLVEILEELGFIRESHEKATHPDCAEKLKTIVPQISRTFLGSSTGIDEQTSETGLGLLLHCLKGEICPLFSAETLPPVDIEALLGECMRYILSSKGNALVALEKDILYVLLESYLSQQPDACRIFLDDSLQELSTRPGGEMSEQTVFSRVRDRLGFNVEGVGRAAGQKLSCYMLEYVLSRKWFVKDHIDRLMVCLERALEYNQTSELRSAFIMFVRLVFERMEGYRFSLKSGTVGSALNCLSRATNGGSDKSRSACELGSALHALAVAIPGDLLHIYSTELLALCCTGYRERELGEDRKLFCKTFIEVSRRLAQFDILLNPVLKDFLGDKEVFLVVAYHVQKVFESAVGNNVSGSDGRPMKKQKNDGERANEKHAGDIQVETLIGKPLISLACPGGKLGGIQTSDLPSWSTALRQLASLMFIVRNLTDLSSALDLHKMAQQWVLFVSSGIDAIVAKMRECTDFVMAFVSLSDMLVICSKHIRFDSPKIFLLLCKIFSRVISFEEDNSEGVTNVRTECLMRLSTLPFDNDNYERVKEVIALFGSPSCDIKICALKCLIVTLYQGKHVSPSSIEHVLETASVLLAEPDVSVVAELSSRVGTLISLAGHGDECVREHPYEAFAEDITTHPFEAEYSRVLDHLKSCSGFSEDDLPLEAILPFFGLLDPAKDESVRVGFIKSIPAIMRRLSLVEIESFQEVWKSVLELIVDESVAVRRELASMIGCFMDRDNAAVRAAFGDILHFYKRVRKMLTKHLQKTDTLLETLGALGVSSDGEFLSAILANLLHYILDDNLHIRSTAHDQIRRLASIRGCLINELLLERKSFIFNWLIQEQLSSNPNLFDEILDAFLSMDRAQFFVEAIPVVVPALVCGSFDKALKDLSAHSGTSLADMLSSNVGKILTFSIERYQEFETPDFQSVCLDEIAEFIESHTDTHLESLLKPQLFLLLNEVFWLLGQLHDIGMNDLKNSVEWKNLYTVLAWVSRRVAYAAENNDENAVSNLISERFLGIMSFINDKLHHREISNADRARALRSMNALIICVGDHLHRFVPKVMATLKMLMPVEALHGHICDVWASFVRVIDASTLGETLSEIMVSLLPSIENGSPSTKQKAVSLLEFLIVDKRDKLKPFFSDIPIITTIPALKNVNAILIQESGTKDRQNGVSFSLQLSRLRKCLLHESTSVRSMALDYLKRTITANREGFHEALLAGGETSQLVNEILNAILLRCGDGDKKSKLLSCECLGIIGAIDPARVSIGLRTNKSLELEDDSLIKEIIQNHLVRIIRTAKSTMLQDRAAFGIQELLLHLGCTKETPALAEVYGAGSRRGGTPEERRAAALWLKFPQHVRNVIQAYLDSQYKLTKSSVTNPGRYDPPLYPNCKNFGHWIGEWTVRLISKSRGPREKIFKLCRAVVRDDFHLALYLLPYLIDNVIEKDTEGEGNIVREEIIAVCEDVVEKGEYDKPVSQLSAQTVFQLFDVFVSWVDNRNMAAINERRHLSRRGGADQVLQPTALELLITEIPQDLLAKAAYCCRAYARALKYYEAYIRQQRKQRDESEHLLPHESRFLQLIQLNLSDQVDALDGIAAYRQDTSLVERMLDLENSGQYTEAQTLYEYDLQENPLNLDRHHGFLQCLKSVGHYQGLLTHMDGLLSKHTMSEANFKQYEKLYTLGVEASWRLGQWDSLETHLDRLNGLTKFSNGSRFEVGLGNMLLEARKVVEKTSTEKDVRFENLLSSVRLELVEPLSAACMESYQRAYPLIVKLQMLHELEDGFKSLQSQNEGRRIDSQPFHMWWDSTLRMNQPSMWTHEPILSLRRIIFRLHGMDNRCADTWLRVANLARKSGHFQSASSAILQAKTLGAMGVDLENAKLLWAQGNQHKALMELERNLEVFGARDVNTMRESEIIMFAKTELTVGKWSQISGLKKHDEVIQHYKKVTELMKKWEKGYFFLGKYFDFLLDSYMKQVDEARSRGRGRNTSSGSSTDFIMHSVRNYGNSLVFGHKYIYQSLYRMLTLWFTHVDMDQQRGTHMNDLMKKLIDRLPAYQWLVALPNLISRIGHKSEDLVMNLQHVIVKVLLNYPDQALWSVAAQTKSNIPTRKKRATSIMAQATASSRDPNGDPTLLQQATRVRQLYKPFSVMTEQLIKLCNKPVEKESDKLMIDQDFPALRTCLPSAIIVPVTNSLKVILPSNGKTRPDSSHNPFPQRLPLIDSIRNDVDVLKSLQRPKKISVKGNDGVYYDFLCKPKDDNDGVLRKDMRMMEFNGIVNTLLMKDPESRRRRIRIKTFSIIPLNEECGMIEWVPNTTPFRHILSRLYAFTGTALNSQSIKRLNNQALSAPNPHQALLELYRDILLKSFPPVFHKWFLSTFPEPSQWLDTRTNFARSSAAWAMVGYLVGLGDRHGENILCDSSDGTAVHVDFSCLFDKGKVLRTPEVVPFRLTPNMVDGCGVTGYEGVFRRTCEITMGVLRNNRETMMSVLDTFLHDPLVEWTISKAQNKSSNDSGFVEKAEVTLQKINERLQGRLPESNTSVALSVQGQVHQLIKEAVSQDNLSRMYVWWQPWN